MLAGSRLHGDATGEPGSRGEGVPEGRRGRSDTKFCPEPLNKFMHRAETRSLARVLVGQPRVCICLVNRLLPADAQSRGAALLHTAKTPGLLTLAVCTLRKVIDRRTWKRRTHDAQMLGYREYEYDAGSSDLHATCHTSYATYHSIRGHTMPCDLGFAPMRLVVSMWTKLIDLPCNGPAARSAETGLDPARVYLI